MTADGVAFLGEEVQHAYTLVQPEQPAAVGSQPLALTRRQLVARLTAFAQEAAPEGTPTPGELLRSLGKSPELIPYSTTNFGTP